MQNGAYAVQETAGRQWNNGSSRAKGATHLDPILSFGHIIDKGHQPLNWCTAWDVSYPQILGLKRASHISSLSSWD